MEKNRLSLTAIKVLSAFRDVTTLIIRRRRKQRQKKAPKIVIIDCDILSNKQLGSSRHMGLPWKYTEDTLKRNDLSVFIPQNQS